MSDFDRWWETTGERSLHHGDPKEWARKGWEARDGHFEKAPDLQAVCELQRLWAEEYELAEKASGGK